MCHGSDFFAIWSYYRSFPYSMFNGSNQLFDGFTWDSGSFDIIIIREFLVLHKDTTILRLTVQQRL